MDESETLQGPYPALNNVTLKQSHVKQERITVTTYGWDAAHRWCPIHTLSCTWRDAPRVLEHFLSKNMWIVTQ